MTRRAVLLAVVAALFTTILASPAGAAATRLTGNPHTDLGPVYSREGNKIAFISHRPAGEFEWGNNVFVMNANGTGETNITCTSTECPFVDPQRPLAWAPNETAVVFGGVGGEIYRAAANGNGVVNLSDSPNSWDSRPVYSPMNGSRIFFERWACTDTCEHRISVMDADGSNRQDIVSGGGNFDVSRSDRVAYSCFAGCASGIHVIDADGSGHTRLTDNDQDSFPTFSPDGTQIIFARGFPGHTADLFRINVDGTGETRLTDHGRYSGGGVFDWSFDGTKIAYEWSTADESQFGVAVVDTRDGSSRQIFGTAASDDGDPSFSPNSMKLAYFSDQDDLGNVDVYTETVYTATAEAAPLSATSTGTGAGATPSDPTTTSVFTHTGGTVSIEETAERTQQGPPEYQLIGEQVNIEAPPSTEVTPLGITFRLDASQIPAGENERTVQVFRNGVLVPDCSGPAGVASPDPCVAERSLLEDGDVQFEVLTSHASAWNFGVGLIKPYLAGRMGGASILATDDGRRVRHNFDLECDQTRGPNRLEVATGSGTFSLQLVTRIVCHDDASAGLPASRAGFDTLSGEGTGTLNGLPARAEWSFVDNGEPGHADVGRIVVKDAAGVVVMTASGSLIGGNYQAKG